jgi:peptidoglycan/xylan/chitin deacetylase (PgdA/CDA1 family)
MSSAGGQGEPASAAAHGLKSVLRGLGVRLASGGLGRALLAARGDGQAAIFMLHRFRLPGLDVEGPTIEQVRLGLELLRRRRYPVLGLEDLLGGLGADRPGFRHAVAFTIDDGYAEQAEVAQGVFAAYDCPVTIFLMTGFLDGTHWPWWDQLEYAFDRTGRARITIELPAGPLRYDCGSPIERRQAAQDLARRCKDLPDDALRQVVRRVGQLADVELPAQAPAGYRPMSWEQARGLERKGTTFGAHTVSHPVLSRVDDARSRAEIEGSLARLRAELSRPVPLFCYPNGKAADFGPREQACLAELGLAGALAAERGYATWSAIRRDPRAAYALSRFAWPDRPEEVLRYASGAERLRQMLLGDERIQA